jgi:hypothetical protein
MKTSNQPNAIFLLGILCGVASVVVYFMGYREQSGALGIAFVIAMFASWLIWKVGQA